jgi:hypothetical protein
VTKYLVMREAQIDEANAWVEFGYLEDSTPGGAVKQAMANPTQGSQPEARWLAVPANYCFVATATVETKTEVRLVEQQTRPRRSRSETAAAS